jgi:hypothetical protein
MRPLVEQGVVRILPASAYNAVEDRARTDNELEKSSYLPGEYTKILGKDGKQSAIIGDMERSASFPDYYVVCASCDWDDALFDDFQADSCVVIKQPKTFVQRLTQAAEEKLQGWAFVDVPVQYFDPYEMRLKSIINPSVDKHFRFAYQREYRFVWAPLQGQSCKQSIHLVLGSLSGIAELYMRGRS